MNRRNLTLIISGLVLAITALFIAMGFNYYRTRTIAEPVNQFIQGLTTDSTSQSLFTEAYLTKLQETKDSSAIDAQGFDAAYGDFASVIKYTGVSNVNISGDTATCIATAVETTTNSLTEDKSVSNQTYRLGLKKVNDEWKIDSAKLIESRTK